MAQNPLFRPTTSPTNTTKPTKAVNNTGTSVRLSHNTFDNSYFNFKTQRYGLLEPFFWKDCVAGDNEPFSNSHNVRSLPFASPILSPMKLNKDYFMIPKYAIQPHTWDYIFKNPNQGDDVPFDAQNLFPLVASIYRYEDASEEAVTSIFDALDRVVSTIRGGSATSFDVLRLLVLEQFFSSGGLLYNLGFKFNPIFTEEGTDVVLSFDEFFDFVFGMINLAFTIAFDDPDTPSGLRYVSFVTDSSFASGDYVIDKFTALSLLRSYFGSLTSFSVPDISGLSGGYFVEVPNYSVTGAAYGEVYRTNIDPLDCVRLDNVVAYQYACAQYYVNPRVDYLYNAQLFRDNYIQLVRQAYPVVPEGGPLNLSSFNLNGIPVLYDYFSLYYHWYSFVSFLAAIFRTDIIEDLGSDVSALERFQDLCNPVMYLFSYREQLRFGNYFTDSRTQALGYGQPGSDTVVVNDDQSISVTDLSQKLVLERFRAAVAHLDGSAEDYLQTMFHEQLPPDYHYPKFIAHSEFAINGSEVSNTTSDNQGNIVTNLKSGDDTAEFNVVVNIPSILIGISYVSIPETYCQLKERQYFHGDRYDMFQPMLQYFGDQAIFNREVSDDIPNPADAYGYVSRNGEYKQRVSQVSGGFLTRLRSWIFTVDLPAFAGESAMPRLAYTQSPLAIRAHDYEFNRFLSAQTGLSLGTGFHFIMQYNNKNVDNRPMDVNPLPLYPSNNL